MLTEHLTLRMNRQLRDDLTRRGRQLREDPTALARRYIQESLLMDRFPGIRYWQRPGGREAMLAGHRLSVGDVVQRYQFFDSNIQKTAEWLSISPWLIEQALGYYAACQEEIDQQLSAKDELVDQLRAEWLEEQRVLAK